MGEARRSWQDQRADEQRRYPEVYAAYATFLQSVEAGDSGDEDRPMIQVVDPSEIPSFASEAEEHEYWGTHAFGAGLVVRAGRSPGGRTRPVPIRFDADTLGRLRRLAARRGTGYQTLLRAFVLERLYEEEVRDGIVTPARDLPLAR